MLDHARCHDGRIQQLLVEVDAHALAFHLRLRVARAKVRLGLVHVDQMHPSVRQARHVRGEAQGDLRLAGARLADEHEILLFPQQRAELIFHHEPFPFLDRAAPGVLL